ncbi:hypothetical protein COY95_02875 [Candidatus Woesearchaeota archaeon CG_4_10_14_0_8_um_filter_47_5]|nr:MAG: hypothetical protein COY95_02875 [Candidatus Woesearchaeota archaeon CG_4_10_14_0_8_um_filter_47_5]
MEASIKNLKVTAALILLSVMLMLLAGGCAKNSPAQPPSQNSAPSPSESAAPPETPVPPDSSPSHAPDQPESAAPSPAPPASEFDRPPTPEPEEPQQPGLTLPPEVLALKEKSAKVTTMRYVYQDPTIAPGKWQFYIFGKKIKIKLPQKAPDNPATNFDTIYMDTEKKAAVAYCEDTDKIRCPDPLKNFSVSYSEYYKKTPYQWIQEVPYATTKTGESIDGRETLLVVYDKGGATYSLNVDTYYGLPLRIAKQTGKTIETYRFEDFSTTGVKESDVVHG